MSDAETITASMQDYLKTMLTLSESEHQIRVTDIAARLNVAKSSVAQEIDHLKKHGLVIQEKYGPVELTNKGKGVAREIKWRHGKLQRFLIEVLGVDPAIAEKDACLMEHAVSAHTMNRLMKYLEASKSEDGNRADETRTDSSVREAGEIVISHEEAAIRHVKTLNELKTGEKGNVLKIATGGSLRNRLMDMGITTGAELEIKRVAPMGDPIEVRIKGYNLSLRKKEASAIYLEMKPKDKE